MDLRDDSFFNFPDNHIYMRTKKTKKVTKIIVASHAEFSGMEFETIQAGVKFLQYLSNSASAVD